MEEQPVPVEEPSSSANNAKKTFGQWQAADRDTPGTIEFKEPPYTELNDKLSIFLKMDGANAMDEGEVLKVTGIQLSRPRRYHKIFERMGLLYRVGKVTKVSSLGKKVLETDRLFRSQAENAPKEIAKAALAVLKKYQLKNPVDEEVGEYPASCDVHPYYVIWKAADELEGKLHWDEFNREIMRVLREDELAEVIDRIRTARKEPDYDPVKGGSATAPLRDRCYNQTDAPAGKTPDGQIRDQITSPWFKRAGFGGILLDNPGAGGSGYWKIPDGVRDLVHEAVSTAPTFHTFGSVQDWQAYFYSLAEQPVKSLDVHRISLADIKESLQKVAPDLTFKDQLLARVISGFSQSNRKFFTILTGVSGTGKTQLVIALAKAVYQDALISEPQLTIVTVRPDWTDSTGILGYYNPIERRYVRPAFLEALIAADSDRNNPYFVCLDEMNLAKVEYYLAECLSAMESENPIYLDRQTDVTGVPDKLRWPPNLYLFGTVNIDESTQPISDKVADRAQVIDTSDIDIKELMDKWLAESAYLTAEQQAEVSTTLNSIWAELKQQRAHFGFRTTRAIISYIDNAVGRTGGILTLNSALDNQIEQKILPKLRGDGDRWADTLTNLSSIISPFSGSSAIINRMRESLEKYGSFQFWGY